MNCEDYRGLLVGFHDRELSPSEEALVTKHLEECAACVQEMEQIRQFARQMHAATVPFRRSTERIQSTIRDRMRESVRPVQRINAFLQPRWIGLAVAVLAVAGFFLLRPPQSNIERLASWGTQNYALVDQTHPVQGNEETVRLWFQEHHRITIVPPQRADYSHLTGCKMAEFDSHPVPLLRFMEKEVRAIFILPGELLSGSHPQVLTRRGYRIELWKEGQTAYMAMTNSRQ